MNQILFGDCRETLRKLAADGVRVQTCVTSPPYFGLRSYGGGDLEIGQEETPEQFIANLVEVFRCVRNVLADDGTLWVNIGDSYIASATGNVGKSMTITGGKANQDAAAKRPDKKPSGDRKTKDLIGIPWMLAFALRADGWYLRQDIIWHKPNPMPSSVRDRCTSSHEHVFLLSKRPKYRFNAEALSEKAEDGGKRNRRDVWSISAKGFSGAHFAVFPPALIEPCILAGSRPGDVVLDPFMGSGTTAAVALQHGRQYLGMELNPEYKGLQDARIAAALPVAANDCVQTLIDFG